jgi:hypothetical protein
MWSDNFLTDLIARSSLAAMSAAAFVFSGSVFAQSASYNHNYVNTMRSGTVSHFYVSQSLDGEYGTFSATTKPGKSADALASAGGLGPSSDSWRGFGIGTAFGLEILKFVQFTGGHTFVSLRRNDDGLQTLSGSRLHAGAKFVFTAPLANLELGGGLLGSRMDFVQRLQRGDYYGSGVFYSLGMNYFLSSQVSIFGSVKTLQERLVQTGGDSSFDTIRNQATSIGTGFSIWL